jgi:hypothetical protein
MFCDGVGVGRKVAGGGRRALTRLSSLCASFPFNKATNRLQRTDQPTESHRQSDILDWHGDHLYTNYHETFNVLVDAGGGLDTLTCW